MEKRYSILLKYIAGAILIFTLNSCNQPKQQLDAGNIISDNYTIEYAKGFEVKKYETYTEVLVSNPWDTTRLLQRYILIDKNKEVPENLPKGVLVRTPLQNVVAYSNIHCSALNEINNLDIVKGVFDLPYINLVQIQEKAKAGKIVSLGMSSAPDIERLMMLSPEAIFATPVTGQSYGSVEKTKIPLIEALDYTEPHPLGQAEWIKFYALFTGQEALADSLFTITAQNYNEIKAHVAKANKAPSVLTDMKYMDSWNTPGGKSFMATMLADAGSTFVWSDNNSTTFMPLAFETVLDKAGDAEFWIIKYYSDNDLTYRNLKKEYKLYSSFRAYKERNIYGCNTSKTDYYLDLPIHPDYILKDIAFVFHPHLFPEYTPRYFKKLTE